MQFFFYSPLAFLRAAVKGVLVQKSSYVDKINPFHIKMFLGQIIEIEETGYVRIVTEYEKVNTLITPSQLYPCTASNNFILDLEQSQ